MNQDFLKVLRNLNQILNNGGLMPFRKKIYREWFKFFRLLASGKYPYKSLVVPLPCGRTLKMIWMVEKEKEEKPDLRLVSGD